MTPRDTIIITYNPTIITNITIYGTRGTWHLTCRETLLQLGS